MPTPPSRSSALPSAASCRSTATAGRDWSPPSISPPLPPRCWPMHDGAARHRRWQVGAALLSVALLLAALPLAIPLAYLSDRGVSIASLDWVGRYFTSLRSEEHTSELQS